MSPAEFLGFHGLQLALGSTVLLGLGCVWVARSSNPVHTRRKGALVAWGILAFLVLGALPLPRLASPSFPGPSFSSPSLSSPNSSSTSAERPRDQTEVWAPEPTEELRSAAQPISLLDEVGIEPLEYPGERAHRPLPSTLVPSAFGVATPGGERAPWLLSLYLLGVGLCTAYLLAGGIHLGLLLRRAVPAPRWVMELFAGTESGPRPQVLVGTGRFRPFCIGFPRPRILLPARLCRPERRGQLRQVLLHELGHFRSGGSQLPFTLILPVLFFHPLFWWLRARVRLASEVLADDWAARHSSKIHYARELIALAEDDVKHRLAPLGASCIFRSHSEFYRRIKMLLERDGHLSTRCSLRRNIVQTTAAIALVGLTAGLWGAPPVAAQRPGQSAQQPGVPRGDSLESLRKERNVLRDEIARVQARLDQVLSVMARGRGTTPATVTVWGPGGGVGPMDTRIEEGEARGRMRIVVVEVGDTFQSLLRQYMGGIAAGDEVLSLNPSLDPRSLRVGQELVFPAVDPPRDPAAPGITTFFKPRTDALANPISVPSRQVSGGPAAQGSILNSATLQLVTQTIEMGADLESAEEELSHLEELAEADLMDRRSVRQARRDVNTARRKAQLFSSLIKAEIEAAAEELQLLHLRSKDYAKGSIRHLELQGQMRRAERRIEILQSVL